MIFISYAHEDAAAARRLSDDLTQLGYEVWFDNFGAPRFPGIQYASLDRPHRRHSDRHGVIRLAALVGYQSTKVSRLCVIRSATLEERWRRLALGSTAWMGTGQRHWFVGMDAILQQDWRVGQNGN